MPSTVRKRVPVIGINCSSDRAATSILDPNRALKNSLPLGYIRSVEMAGGLPLLLPLVRDPRLIAQMLDQIDGLILSGGHDIDPSYYGQSPHPKLDQQDVAKDRFESELVPLALKKKNLPVLGICRGIQAINVFAGGTLYQDISLAAQDLVKHRQETSQSVPTHLIEIESGTRLHQIFGKRKLLTNSYHHQAVERVAPGFRVSARSEDGIIEAIEKPGERFLIGFQPHPELLAEDYPDFLKLFKALVEAAGNGVSKRR